MIIATDVHYRDSEALAVSIEFRNWNDEIPDKIYRVKLTDIAGYEPGVFYKRELPCILEVFKKINLEKTDVILIDGYVTLDDKGKMGLGAHLFEALNKKIPVIGVAKTRYSGLGKNVQEVFRGKSGNPLYVTSMGIPPGEAADRIRFMHGRYRIPTLLRLLDSKTREQNADD